MKEKCTITFSSGGKSATISGDDLTGLAKTLGKEEHQNDCPRCHVNNKRQWVWLGRVMNKCQKCGRIWSWQQ